MKSRTKESKLRILLFDQTWRLDTIKGILSEDKKVFSKLVKRHEEAISELCEKYDILVSHLSSDSDGLVASFAKRKYGKEILTLGVSGGGLEKYKHNIAGGLLIKYDELIDGTSSWLSKEIQLAAEKHGFYLYLIKDRFR